MKKLIVLSLVAMLAVPMTVHAEEDRIAALEEKVAELEQRVAALEGTAPTGVSEAPAQEAVEGAPVETGVEFGGCTLEYVDFEIATDYEGDECVVLYFDYFNGSGDTSTYSGSFDVVAYQHGKAMDHTGVTGNEAYEDLYTKIRSGADPLRVASCFKLTDMTEIIVSMKGFLDFDGDPVEFTLALE